MECCFQKDLEQINQTLPQQDGLVHDTTKRHLDRHKTPVGSAFRILTHCPQVQVINCCNKHWSPRRCSFRICVNIHVNIIIQNHGKAFLLMLSRLQGLLNIILMQLLHHVCRSKRATVKTQLKQAIMKKITTTGLSSQWLGWEDFWKSTLHMSLI